MSVQLLVLAHCPVSTSTTSKTMYDVKINCTGPPFTFTATTISSITGTSHNTQRPIIPKMSIPARKNVFPPGDIRCFRMGPPKYTKRTEATTEGWKPIKPTNYTEPTKKPDGCVRKLTGIKKKTKAKKIFANAVPAESGKREEPRERTLGRERERKLEGFYNETQMAKRAAGRA